MVWSVFLNLFIDVLEKVLKDLLGFLHVIDEVKGFGFEKKRFIFDIMGAVVRYLGN